MKTYKTSSSKTLALPLFLDADNEMYKKVLKEFEL